MSNLEYRNRYVETLLRIAKEASYYTDWEAGTEHARAVKAAVRAIYRRFRPYSHDHAYTLLHDCDLCAGSTEAEREARRPIYTELCHVLACNPEAFNDPNDWRLAGECALDYADKHLLAIAAERLKEICEDDDSDATEFLKRARKALKPRLREVGKRRPAA